jgi:hypothetical protein
MIGLVALLACILAAFLGFQLGFFRTAALAGVTLFAGLGSFNWGVPLGHALAPDAPGATTLVLIVAFLTSAGVLFFVCYRLAPTPLRMPWLLNDLGGALVGAFMGWLVAGVILASARFTPDVDSWIRKTRGPEAHAPRSSPDGFWFAVMRAASDQGLHRRPKRVFDADLELPPTRPM